jgi:PAS domain-containing protein
MRPDAAYLVADPSGACLHGTPAALRLLGIDGTALRGLKLGDLFPAGTPDGLPQRLAGATTAGTWTATEAELYRGDGNTVRVELASMRAPSGELVVRLNSTATDEQAAPDVHEVLQAWRREELEMAACAPGTPEHLLADVEAQRLSAEYRRLVAAVADNGLSR